MGNILELYSQLGTYARVAEKLGIDPTTASRRIKKALQLYPARLPSSQIVITPQKTVTRSFVIGDLHQMPEKCIKRFRLLAMLCNELEPDEIRQMGDWDDVLSLCGHERNETYKGKLKPSLQSDIDASQRSHELFSNTLRHKCPKIITFGNHEERIWTYENNNPEMHGIPTATYTGVFEAHGWDWHRYGEYSYTNGVRYTHAPFNGMGKPIGGDNGCKMLAEKSTEDTVWAHTHTLSLHVAQKFGHNKGVTAFNVGSAMIPDYMAGYATNCRKANFYGAHLITARDGKIDTIKSWSLKELEEKYGDGA